MKLKGIIDEDFVNYKNICTCFIMPYCSFKCDKECGRPVCQNSQLANAEIIDISIDKLIDRYINNTISEAIVFQGLEPFDSYDELYAFIYKFTERCKDDIVIYTGYNEDEIVEEVETLVDIIESNKLIIKYGRFIPDDESVYDEILGVKLASKNQYAKIVN